jgi:hypothetical protein
LGPLFAKVPGGVLAALFESLTRHRGRPRVGHRLTGCSKVAVKRGSAALPHLTFYLQNSTFWRADERTRTADPSSLRVITQALQGCAGDCKCHIFRGVSFLRVAACCTVLRSRWYQSGIRTSDSYSATAGPTARPRVLRSHNRRHLFLDVAVCCRIRLSKQISLLMVARRFWV